MSLEPSQAVYRSWRVLVASAVLSSLLATMVMASPCLSNVGSASKPSSVDERNPERDYAPGLRSGVSNGSWWSIRRSEDEAGYQGWISPPAVSGPAPLVTSCLVWPVGATAAAPNIILQRLLL